MHSSSPTYRFLRFFPTRNFAVFFSRISFERISAPNSGISVGSNSIFSEITHSFIQMSCAVDQFRCSPFRILSFSFIFTRSLISDIDTFYTEIITNDWHAISLSIRFRTITTVFEGTRALCFIDRRSDLQDSHGQMEIDVFWRFIICNSVSLPSVPNHVGIQTDFPLPLQLTRSFFPFRTKPRKPTCDSRAGTRVLNHHHRVP